MRKIKLSFTLPLKIAIIASGGGSTALAVFLATLANGLLYGLVEVVCVVATAPGIGAVEKLRKAGLPDSQIHELCYRELGTEEYGRHLLMIFEANGVDLFCQLGAIPKTPAVVMKKYPGLNQHPAPTPWMGGRGFYGLTPHIGMRILAAMLAPRQIYTEATFQIAADDYDLGFAIRVASLLVDPALEPKAIQDALLPMEHENVVRALLSIAQSCGWIDEVESSIWTSGPPEPHQLSAVRSARRAALIASGQGELPEVKDPCFLLPWEQKVPV